MERGGRGESQVSLQLEQVSADAEGNHVRVLEGGQHDHRSCEEWTNNIIKISKPNPLSCISLMVAALTLLRTVHERSPSEARRCIQVL